MLFRTGSVVRNPPAKQEIQVQSPDWEDPLEEEMATHSVSLVWEIPWTEEPGGLQTVYGVAESQTWKWLSMHAYIPSINWKKQFAFMSHSESKDSKSITTVFVFLQMIKYYFLSVYSIL